MYLICAELEFNILAELLSVAPELKHAYVVDTIGVKEQKLNYNLGKPQVDEFDYKMRKVKLSVSDTVALECVSDVLVLNKNHP